MNDVTGLVQALALGTLLGALFFGGLWWTVQKAVSSQRPALWFFVSLLLRTSLALAGFYFIAKGHWERLIVCLLGFVIARAIITRLQLPPPADKRNQPRPEVSHVMKMDEEGFGSCTNTLECEAVCPADRQHKGAFPFGQSTEVGQG